MTLFVEIKHQTENLECVKCASKNCVKCLPFSLYACLSIYNDYKNITHIEKNILGTKNEVFH